jgi:hypothetical protein
MANAIGIRIYLMTCHRAGNRKPVPFGDPDLTTPPAQFLMDFTKTYSAPTQDNALQRSWYFAPKKQDPNGSSKGHIQYGTFGFESDFVDAKTKNKNYRRKTTDVEEIPLFYEFWCPSKRNHVLLAFQSFHGRSCIQMITEQMSGDFERGNPEFRLNFKKLLPFDRSGGIYHSAPVKSLRLIKRRAAKDLADKYTGGHTIGDVHLEMVIRAQRSGLLGRLADVKDAFGQYGQGLAAHDGVIFDEATAEIVVGTRRRRVGVLGANGDAGVIDLTEEIELGSNGHPTFESMCKESDQLLKEFEKTLSGIST